MIKIKWSHDHLIFITGIFIPGKTGFIWKQVSGVNELKQVTKRWDNQIANNKRFTVISRSYCTALMVFVFSRNYEIRQIS